MCFYKGVRVTRAQLIDLLNKEKLFKALELKLIAGYDYSEWPIIKPDGIDWDIVQMQWGFAPPFVTSAEALKDARLKYATYNARNDKLLSSPIWRDAALNRRCLVPVSYFFEFRHVPKFGKNGQLLKATDKYPYCITASTEHEEPLFFMAGIWQPFTDKLTGETFNTYAVVTTEANELMRVVNNSKDRMPTILPKKQAEQWISSDLTSNEIEQLASYQIDSDYLFARPVAKDFKIADDPTIEVDYPELEPLDI